MEIYLGTMIFILGAVLGSFLGCMGYRIPNKIKTTYPSSFCANCKKPLKWYMNIPIISYIRQKGKCAYCNTKIGFIYFFVEILCASLFLLNFILFSLSYKFIISCILTCLLSNIIVSDFESYYISDRVLIISGILILLANHFLAKDIAIERIISAIFILIIMILIKLLGNFMFKRESLGDGDIKLMAILSLTVGWLNSLIALFIACVSGLIYAGVTYRKDKDSIVPFGPFLVFGTLIAFYFQDIIFKFFNMVL